MPAKNSTNGEGNTGKSETQREYDVEIYENELSTRRAAVGVHRCVSQVCSADDVILPSSSLSSIPQLQSSL